MCFVYCYGVLYAVSAMVIGIVVKATMSEARAKSLDLRALLNEL